MRFLSSGYSNKRSIQLQSTENGCEQFDDLPFPSYVIQEENLIFSLSEQINNSSLYSYQTDGTSLTFRSKLPTKGTEMCHISYSKKHRLLFGSCWGSGHLIVASVKEDGSLSLLNEILQSKEKAKEQSRVHCTLLNSDQSSLISCNIGLDTLFVYSIVNGTITLSYTIDCPKGSGPRHAVLSKDDDTLFVVTENSNEILVISLAKKTLLSRCSVLCSKTEKSYCSAICINQEESILYIANRFRDTISVCKIDNKTVTLLKEFPCDGHVPRHMVLTEDEAHLLIAYQQSDYISVVPLDENKFPLFNHSSHFPQEKAAGICELKNF